MDDPCCQPIDDVLVEFPGQAKFIAAVDAAVVAGDKHAVTAALRNALCALIRDDDVLIAHGETVIEPGDHVILFVVDKRRIRDVERLFQAGLTFF